MHLNHTSTAPSSQRRHRTRSTRICATGLAALALAGGVSLVPAHYAQASGKPCIPEMTFFTDKCPH